LKKELPRREKRVSVVSLDDQRIPGSILKAPCSRFAPYRDALEIEEALGNWLRATIRQLEAEKEKQRASADLPR
jgi:hypothetical protein